MGTDRSDARQALAAIVAAPDLGPEVLSDPAALANLLSDYLPGSPRESGSLLAAARAGVPGTLTAHASQGMDPASAIRITAANLANSTGYSADVALWAVSEIAVALGLADDARLPLLAPPSQRTSTGERLEHTTDRPEPAGAVTVPRGSERRRRWPLVAGGVIVVLAAGIPGGAALYYEHARATTGTSGRPLTPAASGSSLAAALPQVTIGTFTGRKPVAIIYGASGGAYLDSIVWSSWTARRGTGAGTEFTNDCVPDCAEGTLSPNAATVTFSQPRNGLFTRLVIAPRNGTPSRWTYPGSWPSAATRHPVSHPRAASPASSGLWTGSSLVMTGDSLGAVTTGMTLVQASAAAGVQMKEVGDGYAYPNGTSGPLGVIGDPVACVFAGAGGPEIRTPQGFVLGRAVTTLRSVYGSHLRYVPAGATSTQGVPSPPEYQVTDAQGIITFAVHKGYVAWMAAGSPASNCGA
jgi:hypothetical protein